MQASGKLHSLAGGTDRLFEITALGTYTFTSLPFGRYRLELTRTGFAAQSARIDVRSAQPVARTFQMALLSVSSNIAVAATTALPGVELPLDEIPAPVQTANQTDLAQSGALDLSDFLNRRLSGVHVNEMQGNPFQPDVNYRGYTASPLLGTPQGLSVYLDGVRQNQPFGDVVSWDLIPRNAISEITLMPGSNPVFGLNTLGGALSIQTKDGVTSPGLSGRVTYGGSGRKAVQAEMGGGNPAGFNWFLAANIFHESGWRFDSPSDVRQAFARLGWRTAKTDLSLTLNYAYNTLTGNGLQDYRLLANNYSSVYTIPDTTGNRSPSFNFRAQHSFGNTLTFSANAWYRNIRTEGINANLNTAALNQSVYQPSAADQAALQAAGYSGYPTSGANSSNTPFPSWPCIAQALQFADPSERCDALTVFSKVLQQDYGISAQMTSLATSGSFRNQFTAGAVAARGVIDFTQNTQYGYLNPNATITGVSAWADGSTLAGGAPVDARVNLHGVTPTWSLFATDTLSAGKAWHFTVSARYNRNTIHNSDRINPGGGPGSLDANQVFGRFNPSAGLTYTPLAAVGAYVNYAQGSRAPTAIELGCADPNNPCNLPNALASDPPLRQVVTATWEAGLRGKLSPAIRWNAGAFHAENRDDILFVASQQTGSGYFQNFGKTRREGWQAGLDAHFHRIAAGLDYTFLSATYQSTETVDGSANNTSGTALSGRPGLDGVITIHPGNRIPLVPKQTGKAFVDVQATSKLSADLNLVAASSSYARGNENNAYRADGKYYLGPGVSPGYAVVNLAAHYDLSRRLQLAVQIDNLFDRHYDTAAQLATTGFTAQGAFIARPFPAYATGDYPLRHATFFAPGAPRRAWIELRYMIRKKTGF
jgi:outer membrane receptor protein involved in Fe transport